MGLRVPFRIAIALFMVLGAALRLYHLGFQCFWWEETYTINMVKHPLWDVITRSILYDSNPPAYYILAHLSMVLSGYQNIAIRYPSVVAGILIIPAMYLLGRTYKDELTGVYCSGISAVLFPLVYYSQYGRSYSLSFLCFIIATVFYIRAARNEGNHSELCFWLMVSVNVWVHLFVLVPLGLMAVSLLVSKLLTRAWYIVLATALCAAPGIILLKLSNHYTIASGYGYGYSPLKTLLLTPLEFFSSLYLLFFALGEMALFIPSKPPKWNLVAVGIVTIVIGLLVSFVVPFFPRYYFVIAFIIIIFVAVSLAHYTGLFPEKYQIPIAAIAVLLFLLLQWDVFSYYYTVQKYICT